MKLLLLRHGVTDWNADKRIQGRIDRPLSDIGIEAIKQRRLADAVLDLSWYCSPLLRARQTAELLGIESPQIEPALIEMDWGDWEGQILKPLRKQLGDEMRSNEARGLDFCPPNGESPRRLQDRLKPWLRQISLQGDDVAAVVHKGIIRCLYALAMDWDMRGESPIEFDWSALHEFELDADGRLAEYHQSLPLISND